MLPLATRIHLGREPVDRRRNARHPLALCVDGPIRAVVVNISEGGMALETEAALAIGDAFEIDLPLAGTVTARVAWSETRLFGCEFAVPISRAAVSAARLRSPVEPAAAEAPPRELVIIGTTRADAPPYGLTVGIIFALLLVAAMFVAARIAATFAVS